MKRKIKKLLSVIFCTLAGFLLPITANAVDFIECSGSNYFFISLSGSELVELNALGRPISANKNSLIITNMGSPDGMDIDKLPECKIIQHDFIGCGFTCNPLKLVPGKYFMSVTLKGNAYHSDSQVTGWSCVSILNYTTGKIKNFKVAVSLKPQGTDFDDIA